MPDYPEAAVTAAAEAIERELMSGISYGTHVDSDEALARAALDAAAPILAEEIARRVKAGSARFEADPEALAWARGYVERLVTKYRGFEATARSEGRTEMASQWRKFANLLRMELIGGEGCVITPFDERRPQFAALLNEEDGYV